MPELDVLVVDDEPVLVGVLRTGFLARGYVVRAAATGAEGLAAVDHREPDLIILDLGLPDADGIEVCRHLRHRTDRPIIVLSADEDAERKVQALDLGADDYVTKPFAMPELLARMRVALRHHDGGPPASGARLTIGTLAFDPTAHEAVLDGRLLELTRKEFDLLSHLMRNPERVLTHRAVLDAVWGPDQPLDTLRTHVSHLRRKLASSTGGPRILTVSGVGYRLLPPPDSGAGGR